MSLNKQLIKLIQSEQAMNTPTPAQALGEALRLISSNPEGVHKIHAEQVALRLLEQHGQHFAGLEDRVNDLELVEETLRAGYARMAEAACCKEDAGKAGAIVMAINELRQRAEAAEARVREAEGLLRKWFMTTHGTLPPEVASFLAANGERHE